MNLPESIDDLNALIRNEVQESVHLDYKDSRALNKAQRHEIAKDVSAFANSDGGILIYGVREEKHLPIEIDDGVDHTEFTREWLEEVVSSNVSPRIENLRIIQIPLSAETSVFAISIPKSNRAPHQEQNTKRYYKRYNFKSQPMEDYETRDIYSRSYSIQPLVNIDIAIKQGVLVYLVITNIGQLTAQNIRFEFSEELTWKHPPSTPPLFTRGIKYLPPGRVFKITYCTIPEAFSEKNDIVSEFAITVRYFHPEIGQEFCDTFYIDLMDYMNTAVIESELYEQSKKIESAIKDLAGKVNTLNTTLGKMLPIAGVTGLDLSIPTIKNLQHIMSNDGVFEKIDPFSCEYVVFKEVLGVNNDLALHLRNHFRQQRNLDNIEKIDGITEDVIKNIQEFFLLDEG